MPNIDMSSTWHVYQHGPVTQVAENLKIVRGELPGMPIGHRMCLVKTPTEDIIIHNPIALSAPDMQAIDHWGTVRTIIIPNGHHRIDSARFKVRYPSATFYCPQGTRSQVQKIIPEVQTIERDFSIAPIFCTPIEGTRNAEIVMHVESRDGTRLVFTDCVFNLPHGDGFFGFLFKLLGSTGGPRVTPLFKCMAVRAKDDLRKHLLQLSTTPGLVEIVMAHGETITENPHQVLQQIANDV